MITVDDREVTQHPTISEELGIPVTVARMDAADYAFLDRNNNPVGIERAEIGNLIQKVRSGELETQLYKCQENFSHVILLREGFYDERYNTKRKENELVSYKVAGAGYYPRHSYQKTSFDWIKAVELRLSDMGIELIDSPNFKYSLHTINILYHQRRRAEEEHTLFKRTQSLIMPVKLTANPAVPQLMALCKRLPEKVAIRLIYKYTTIWNILNTPDKELAEIDGFGKGLIRKLKEGVGII